MKSPYEQTQERVNLEQAMDAYGKLEKAKRPEALKHLRLLSKIWLNTQPSP